MIISKKSALTKKLGFIIMFLCTISFQNYTLAQITRPKYSAQYNYEGKGRTKKFAIFEILPIYEYPWGVCLNFYHDFIRKLNADKKTWIRQAMQLWNTKYKQYVDSRYNNQDEMYLAGLPSLKEDGNHLFTESCNKNTHTLIYVQNANLSETANRITMASWETIDGFRFTYFYGSLKIQRLIKWTRIRFINTMLHELGHALGIPHLPPWRTQIMTYNENSSYCEKYEKICDIEDSDISSFLFYYKKKYKSEYN